MALKSTISKSLQTEGGSTLVPSRAYAMRGPLQLPIVPQDSLAAIDLTLLFSGKLVAGVEP
jgi:hypothetical protein